MGLDCSQVSGEGVFTSHHIGHMTWIAGHRWRTKNKRPAALFMEQKFSRGHALSAHDGSARGSLGWVGSGAILLQHGGLRDNVSSVYAGPVHRANGNFCSLIMFDVGSCQISTL